MEHETATEDENFILIGHRCVTLTTLDCFVAGEFDTLPNDLVAIDLRFDDLAADVIIETTNKIHAKPDRGER